MNKASETYELIDNAGGDLVDAGSLEAMELARIEIDEDQVASGQDAGDYRIVPADTRNCPDGEHSVSHHATVCLADEWTNE